MVKSSAIDAMFVTATVVAVAAAARLPTPNPENPPPDSTSLSAATLQHRASIPPRITTIHGVLGSGTTDTVLLVSSKPRPAQGADIVPSRQGAPKDTSGGEETKEQVSKGAAQLPSGDARTTSDMIIPKLQPSTREKVAEMNTAVRTESNVHEVNVDGDGHQGAPRPTAESGKTYKDGLIPMALAPSLYDEDSHMFILFTVGMLLCAAGYVAFHNKRKILALIIEGRNPHAETRRGGGGINYKRINTCDTGGYGEAVSVA